MITDTIEWRRNFKPENVKISGMCFPLIVAHIDLPSEVEVMARSGCVYVNGKDKMGMHAPQYIHWC